MEWPCQIGCVYSTLLMLLLLTQFSHFVICQRFGLLRSLRSSICSAFIRFGCVSSVRFVVFIRRWWSTRPDVACLSGSTAGCTRRCYSSTCRRRGLCIRLPIKLMAFAVFAMPTAKSIWKTGPFTSIALVISHVPVLISHYSGHLDYQFHVRLLLYLSRQLRRHKYHPLLLLLPLISLKPTLVSSRLCLHISEAARTDFSCASNQAHLLRQAVMHPDISSHWKVVLDWVGSVLYLAKRGGKRHNLTATIRSRLTSRQSSAAVIKTGPKPLHAAARTPTLSWLRWSRIVTSELQWEYCARRIHQLSLH